MCSLVEINVNSFDAFGVDILCKIWEHNVLTERSVHSVRSSV
jgi:hypothetical protein